MNRRTRLLALAAASAAVAGVVLSIFASTPARAVVPTPNITTSLGFSVTYWDPTQPKPANPPTINGLGFNLVHHIDVNGDGTILTPDKLTQRKTTCGDYMEKAISTTERCDLNPDVTVEASILTSPDDLLRASLGIPEITGDLLVIRINAAPSAVVEARKSPPVHLEMSYTITDGTGAEAPTTISYGYETPPGGSIPTRLTAVVGGLETVDLSNPADPELFDKITTTIDTGQFGSTCGSAGCAPGYAGPLKLVAGISQPAQPNDDPKNVTSLDLTYRPMPEQLTFKWDRGANRNIFDYSHKPPGDFRHVASDNDAPRRELDADLTLDTTIGTVPTEADYEKTTINAKIDRLPSKMVADVTTLTEAQRRSQGVVTFDVPETAARPGALPDAAVTYHSDRPPEKPGAPRNVLDLKADVHEIANHVEARWYQPVAATPTQQNCKLVDRTTLPDADGDTATKNSDTIDPCLAFANFKAARFTDQFGKGVGAVELRVANFKGAAPGLVEFVPNRPQYVSQQSRPVSAGSEHLNTLLKARVEQLQQARYNELPDGHDVHTKIGDGNLPFEVHVDTDRRTIEVEPAVGSTPAVFGDLVKATALVDPLPPEITLTLNKADKKANPAKPLRLYWNAATTPDKAPDLDATVEIRGKDAAANAACGAPFTTCAQAEIDHLPLEATLTFLDTPERLRVVLDGIPAKATNPDALLQFQARGKPTEKPMVARFEAARVPVDLFINVETPKFTVTDPKPGEPNFEHKLTRVELYPCQRNAANTACDANEIPIGSAAFDIRNFVDRPSEMPPQPVALTRQFLSAALGEAKADAGPFKIGDRMSHVAGRLDEVREVQYLTPDGMTAGKVRAGVNQEGVAVRQPFSALVSAKEVELTEGDGLQNLEAEAVVDKLPSDVKFCYRGAGEKYSATSFDALTVPCENAQPFAGVDPLVRTPISMDFDSDGEFRLQARLATTDLGKSLEHTTHDEHTEAEIDVRNVPQDITAFVQTPTEAKKATATEEAVPEQTAVRALFKTDPPTAPVTLDFDVAIRDADRHCTDPRKAPEKLATAPDAEIDPDELADDERKFAESLCVRGTIEKLPSHAFLEYDPANEDKENFVFENNGAGINLVDVRMSSVGAEVDDRDTPDAADDRVEPEILVVEGDLWGLPKALKGNLLPEKDTAEFFTAPPRQEFGGGPAGAVTEVDASIRNYIAPDLPVRLPAQRSVRLDKTNALETLPDPTESLVVFKRDDLFKSHVHVKRLARAGFATARDADGQPLDTRIISVDFGADGAIVRAFADLLFSEDEDKPGTNEREDVLSQVSVIGDVTLREKPAGVTVCFRDKKSSDGTPVAPTFCDLTPKANEGAFQVLGRPTEGPPPDESSLDVDAFVRFAQKGGTDLLTAALHIDNVPAAVQGVFSDDGRVEAQGFGIKAVDEEVNGKTVTTYVANTAKKVGIDRIVAQLANFDLPENAGYPGTTPPWGNKVDGPGLDSKTAILGDHFMRLRMADEFYFVQAALGIVSGPDSEAQHVFIDDDPCAKPASNPADYPFFPLRDAISYACLKVHFEPRGGGPAPDPLLVELVKDDGDERLTLNGPDPLKNPTTAGLTKIPDDFQLTFADTDGVDPETTELLPPCGTTEVAGCVPPMIRLDMDHDREADPELFGVLAKGKTGDIESLAAHKPSATTADLNAAPGENGWSDWTSGDGIRAKIGIDKPVIGKGTPEEDEGSATTMLAGIHLPVPRSLTVDQIQKFTCSTGTSEVGAPACGPQDALASPKDPTDKGQNLDLRIRYVARDANGKVKDNLGQLVALVALLNSGKDIIIASADKPKTDGMLLPGELGLAIFMREGWEDIGDSQLRNRKYFQIDGRTSTASPIGARLLGLDGADEIEFALKGMPTLADITQEERDDPTVPSFRLRTEIQDDVSTKGDEGFGLKNLLLSIDTEVDVARIAAGIDFSGARRVDGVVHLGDGNATELRGYKVLDGTADTDEAEINGWADADISELRIWFYAGILIAGAAGRVVLEVNNDLKFTKAKRFKFQNNGPRIKVEHKGASDGNVNVNPDVYPVLIVAVVWVITFFWNSVMVIAYAWPPWTPPQMFVAFFSCNWGTSGRVFEFDVPGNGSADVFTDPAWDPRIIAYGGGEKLGDWAVRLIGHKWFHAFTPGAGGATGLAHLLISAAMRIVGCAVMDVNLKTIDPGKNPGPPVAIDYHDVPGWEDETTPSQAPTPPPPPPPDLDVENGTVEVCDDVTYDEVRVKAGGRLHVCNAAGGLVLRATSVDVLAGGVLDARDATGDVFVVSKSVNVAPDPDKGTDKIDERGKVLAGRTRLSIVGTRLVRVDGLVEANGVIGATNGTGSGNGGAGHAGEGGDGSSGDGSGGPTYENVALTKDDNTGLVPLTAGSKGSAVHGTPGRGGGTIDLMGATVRISGAVTADGTGGSSDTTGLCFNGKGTETTADDQANTGKTGAGGGSGGSVIVAASTIDLSGGRLSAAGGPGGNGKAGGGGGGGGGVVKLVAPLRFGNAVVDGGTGGTNGGCADATAGENGVAGEVPFNDDPASQAAHPDGEFWFRGKDNAAGTTPDANYRLRIPITGAAPAWGPNPNMQVTLCGLHRPPEANEPAPNADPHDDDSSTPDSSDPQFGIDMPTAHDVTRACGSNTGDTKVRVLGRKTLPAGSRIPDDETLAVDPSVLGGAADEGYWGLFTIVAKPWTEGNDCFNHSDKSSSFLNGTLFDIFDCRLEALPAAPDDYIGIDNDLPDASVDIPGIDPNEPRPTVHNEAVQIHITGVADTMARHVNPGSGAIPNQSGVAKIECGNAKVDTSLPHKPLVEDESAYAECLPGFPSHRLTPGSGQKKVFVRLTDVAGNRQVYGIDVWLDVDPPTATLTVEPGLATKLDNGWYSRSPHFRLHGFTDISYDENNNPVPGSGPGVQPYEYWFDNGTHRFCTEANCLINEDDGLPGVGRHTFNWRAIDAAGHVSPVQTQYFKVDGQRPESALLTAPFEADGANTKQFGDHPQDAQRGWFITSPFVVVSGLDEPGGSGLVPNATVDPDYDGDEADDDGPDQPGAGMFIKVDDAPDYVLQTGPTQLTNGVHTVCYFTKDVAGNQSVDKPCVTVHVDTADPVTTVNVAGTTGNNGWFRSPVNVTVGSSDPAGSGVDPAFDSTADLCGQLPAEAISPDTKTPSGACLSIDGDLFRPVTGPVPITKDGIHHLRAFTVDVAGRRSPVVDRIVKVDQTAPIATPRLFPPKPDDSSAQFIWRRTPLVTLLAPDHEDNSGTDRIEVRCTPGPCYASTPAADADKFVTYTLPFPLKDGTTTIDYRGVDKAGNQLDKQLVVKVDTTPPSVAPLTPLVPGGGTWTRTPPSDPSNPVTFRWTMSDPNTTEDALRVSVFVYGGVLDNDVISLTTVEPVRVLRRVEVLPAAPNLSYLWNGKMQTTDVTIEVKPDGTIVKSDVLTLKPAPKRRTVMPLSGRYWYRLVVTDEAGNVAHSVDSQYVEVSS